MLKENFIKFFRFFPKNKKSFFKYSISSFFVGILELFGVALTYPFVLKLLSEEKQGFSPIIIGISIIILFIAKNVFMIFYTYWQSKLTKDIEKEVNYKFFQYFLVAPFEETTKISFAQKSNILNFIIPNVINNFVLRLLNISVNIFIFSLITIFLIIKYPLATLLTTLCAFFLIIIQNKIFKPRLKNIAEQISKASTELNQRSNEALLGIKNVKISHNERFFYNNYQYALKKVYNITREMLFLNSIPPYVTEPFIIILLFVLLSVISIQTYMEPEKLIASFAVIVSAIFRLAPCIARIQVNINGINSVQPLVIELFKYYQEFGLDKEYVINDSKFLEFKNSIEYKNISFSYNDNQETLKNINFTIKKGEFIGIVGLSGAGKTTLIDIFSGLYKHQNGQIFVDDSEFKTMPPLKIGYIPQEFHIINASIRENVALGFAEIDDNRVIDSLKKAQLYDFIQNNYKDGIYVNPFIDNTGFSQGQKQRLAIARALYSNPDILILDEATSSLDLKTEDELCSVLESLKGEKTIIAIAHRLSTIKNSDKILFMKNGTIEDIAPFKELINKNTDFQELLNLATLNPIK